MNNLKVKTLSVALFLSVFALSVSAQPQGGRQQGGRSSQQREQKSPEKIAEILTDKMDQTLDLSDSQEKKIYAINLQSAQDAATKREAMKSGRESAKEGQKAERPSQDEMKAKMKEMKEQKDAVELSIMKLLDDSQKIKYAKMLASTSKGHGGRGGAQMGRGQQRGGKRPQMSQGRGQQGSKSQSTSRGGASQGKRPQKPTTTQAAE